MKNESGKHYFSLDTNCYSKYPSEQEILLQAGLIFKFKSIRETDDLTIIELESSEALVKKHDINQLLLFIIPFLVYYLQQIFITVIIMNRTNIFNEEDVPEFGSKGWDLVMTFIYFLFLFAVWATFHMLIQRFKYFVWYPALVCIILRHIGFFTYRLGD